MTCDKYENALRLAAASNGELDAKLARHVARHLERCSTCRMTLRSEGELLSRIDGALRAQVNEAPRPDFLAQLRLQLSKEQTVRPGADRRWHAAGAVLALVLIAMSYPLVNPLVSPLVNPLVNARRSSVRETLQTPTVEVPQSAGVMQSARASEDLGVQSRHSKRSAVQSAVRQEPEVLVPPDEQRAFEQFVACVARRDTIAQAVATPAANKTVNTTTELPRVSSVDIADLQLGRAQQEEWADQTGSSE
jgi:anti-sigma factor RsiW